MSEIEAVGEAIELLGGVPKAATALGVSQQLVYFWRQGKRDVGPALAVAIERLTDGRVTRRDLRPHDAHLIWPDLAGRRVA